MRSPRRYSREVVPACVPVVLVFGRQSTLQRGNQEADLAAEGALWIYESELLKAKGVRA